MFSICFQDANPIFSTDLKNNFPPVIDFASTDLALRKLVLSCCFFNLFSGPWLKKRTKESKPLKLMKEIDTFWGGLPSGFKAIVDSIAATSSGLDFFLICLVQVIDLICCYINQINHMY